MRRRGFQCYFAAVFGYRPPREIRPPNTATAPVLLGIPQLRRGRPGGGRLLFCGPDRPGAPRTTHRSSEDGPLSQSGPPGLIAIPRKFSSRNRLCLPGPFCRWPGPVWPRRLRGFAGDGAAAFGRATCGGRRAPKRYLAMRGRAHWACAGVHNLGRLVSAAIFT